MGGVELAPPADGLRWGREVSAAAVKRGVLLRPIGDTVILMPPLTVTSPEIHRIVTAVFGRDRRRVRHERARMTWDAWAEGEAPGDPRIGSLARAAGSRRRGPEVVAPDAAPSFRLRRTTISGLTTHPAVIAAAHEALDRWGSGAGSARLIVGIPAGAYRARARARRVESRLERAALFPTGFGRRPGVLTTFGTAGS